MPRGSFAPRRITESIEKGDDAFGNRVVQTTSLDADLAGHYPYSPERWHVLVNDVRQFPQYEAVPEFTDEVDVHLLMPQNAGDVVTLKTTETFRYRVGYVLEWSAALATNQPLQTGDVVAVGYGDPDLENTTDDTPGPNADGWFLYWNADHDDGEVTVAQYRDGTEQDARRVETQNAVDEWTRYEGRTNWYSVGRTRFSETYTYDDDELGPSQNNTMIGRTAINDGRGPTRANKRLRFSLKAGDGAGSLSVEAGSAAIKSLGGADAITREKTHEFRYSPSAADVWEPAHAMRVDPERDIVNIQVRDTDIVSFDDAEDVVATIQVFDLAKVADADGNPLDETDWDIPTTHSPQNSAVEVSDAVGQFADSTGSLVVSTDNPGGYQVGYSSWYTTGTGSKAQVAGGGRTRKRQIPDGDVAVVLVKATSATPTIVGEIITEQDW